MIVMLQMLVKSLAYGTSRPQVSNLSTAYNLVNINLAHVIIENQYCGGGGNSCEAEVDLASTSVLVGAILGQLTFGYVGDCLGRAKALQLTMALSILGALASAFAVPIGHKASSIFYFIAITRFFLGVGVGAAPLLSPTRSFCDTSSHLPVSP